MSSRTSEARPGEGEANYNYKDNCRVERSERIDGLKQPDTTSGQPPSTRLTPQQERELPLGVRGGLGCAELPRSRADPVIRVHPRELSARFRDEAVQQPYDRQMEFRIDPNHRIGSGPDPLSAHSSRLRDPKALSLFYRAGGPGAATPA